MRTLSYVKNGCNAFNSGDQKSTPLSFWLEDDVWEYLKEFNVEYSDIYNMGYKRTGCMFCMFGIHKSGKDNFIKMQKTHPKQYNYCINKLGIGKVLDFIGAEYEDRQLDLFNEKT